MNVPDVILVAITALAFLIVLAALAGVAAREHRAEEQSWLDTRDNEGNLT